MSHSRFGGEWFDKHQRALLWLLNAPVLGLWFRWVLRIHGDGSSVGRRKIASILPHAIAWVDGSDVSWEFRTHPKFAKRVYYAFRPVWDFLRAWEKVPVEDDGVCFGKTFFTRNQPLLLYLLNGPLRRWFRYIMRVIPSHSDIGDREVTRISPNAIWWEDGGEYVAEFRTRAKYSRRVYYAFRPLWWGMHVWDLFADRWVPRWSFGFATLQTFPDPDPESTSVDGYVQESYTDTNGISWSALRGGAGTGGYSSDVAMRIVDIYSDSITDQWRRINRAIVLFDTSALTSNATISAAVMGLYGTDKLNTSWTTYNDELTIGMYTSNPASNTNLVAGDYDCLGSVQQSDTLISYTNWSTAGYNNWILNSTGRGNISKTDVSKFGIRNKNFDVDNVEPVYAAYMQSWCAASTADETGSIEAYDPKLLVTYTLPATTSPYTSYSELSPVANACAGPVHRGTVDESWSTIRSGAGTYQGSDETGSHTAIRANCSGTTNQFASIRRYIAMFDTSPIGAGKTVSAATVSLYCDSKADPQSNAPNWNVYRYTGSSTTSLVTGDYGNIDGATPLCDTNKTYAGTTTGAYNDWVLNASGRSDVNTTGITKMGWRNQNYDVANSAPTWASGVEVITFSVKYPGNGLSYDPKLVVTYGLDFSFTGTFFGPKFFASQRTIEKLVTGAVWQTDSWQATRTIQSTRTGNIAAVDTWTSTRLVNKLMTGAVTATVTWQSTKTYDITLTGSLASVRTWLADRMIEKYVDGSITAVDTWTSVLTGIRVDQEYFQYYRDDGSESAATALGALNQSRTGSPSDFVRLRFLVYVTGEAGSRQYKLEWRREGTDTWREVIQ